MFKDSEFAESTIIHICYPLLFMDSGIAAKILVWIYCHIGVHVPSNGPPGTEGQSTALLLVEMFFI